MSNLLISWTCISINFFHCNRILQMIRIQLMVCKGLFYVWVYVSLRLYTLVFIHLCTCHTFIHYICNRVAKKDLNENYEFPTELFLRSAYKKFSSKYICCPNEKKHSLFLMTWWMNYMAHLTHVSKFEIVYPGNRMVMVWLNRNLPIKTFL